MTMASSVFLDLGIFSNFNFIFNLVVAPICHRSLHRQPIYHSMRLDKMHLLLELYFETCVYSIELQSFEKALCALLNSAKGVYNQPVFVYSPTKPVF